MKIEVACRCGKRFAAQPNLAGTTITCRIGTVFSLFIFSKLHAEETRRYLER